MGLDDSDFSDKPSLFSGEDGSGDESDTSEESFQESFQDIPVG